MQQDSKFLPLGNRFLSDSNRLNFFLNFFFMCSKSALQKKNWWRLFRMCRDITQGLIVEENLI